MTLAESSMAKKTITSNWTSLASSAYGGSCARNTTMTTHSISLPLCAKCSSMQLPTRRNDGDDCFSCVADEYSVDHLESGVQALVDLQRLGPLRQQVDQDFYPFHSQYQVIDTDYDNYAVVYGCDNHFLFLYHTYSAQLLSKQMWLDEKYLTHAQQKIGELVNYDAKKNWRQRPDPTCGFGVWGDFDEYIVIGEQ
eukprot:CAMPEP_0170491688 /NCGR_PEP_ID=MMETSP0208-20121228/11199_1 /TAXON_ID=197538 /ORGANISM="Strombidium inclinatum, Strain S3" /LENGTH=194 /DNA_ID=CAMNT_0010767303 /DNA_START=73 /DNA_END=659 /DNA_ORIENTATION=-